MASQKGGKTPAGNQKTAYKYVTIKREDENGEKGQETLLVGFEFQLVLERNKNAARDQFKDTKAKIKTYASSKLKHNKKEILKVFDEMEENNVPIKMAKPANYATMDDWDKEE